MLRAILISVGAVLVGLVFLLFGINRHSVQIDFLLFNIQPQPLSSMLALFFIAGFLAGFFLIGWAAMNYRRRVKKMKSQLAAADQEISHLRRNAIQD